MVADCHSKLRRCCPCNQQQSIETLKWHLVTQIYESVVLTQVSGLNEGNYDLQ